MTPDELVERLRHAAAADPDRVVYHSYEIVEMLERSHADVALVRTILTFMEQNPDLDFGAPGPLVHFVERFHGAGYDAELFASLERRPTPHTLMMLQRLINGATTVGERTRLLWLLEKSATHPAADTDLRELVAYQLGLYADRSR